VEVIIEGHQTLRVQIILSEEEVSLFSTGSYLLKHKISGLILN
jgi:hypothetical protein